MAYRSQVRLCPPSPDDGKTATPGPGQPRRRRGRHGRSRARRACRVSLRLARPLGAGDGGRGCARVCAADLAGAHRFRHRGRRDPRNRRPQPRQRRAYFRDRQPVAEDQRHPLRPDDPARRRQGGHRPAKGAGGAGPAGRPAAHRPHRLPRALRLAAAGGGNQRGPDHPGKLRGRGQMAGLDAGDRLRSRGVVPAAVQPAVRSGLPALRRDHRRRGGRRPRPGPRRRRLRQPDGAQLHRRHPAGGGGHLHRRLARRPPPAEIAHDRRHSRAAGRGTHPRTGPT